MKLNNILTPIALRSNTREANTTVRFFATVTLVLTQYAVGHSARSAGVRVYVETCAFMWMRQTGTQHFYNLKHIYTARLHVLPRDPLLSVAQQCALASSAARRRYRLGEGESTSNVSIASRSCQRRRAVFKLIRHRQEEEAQRVIFRRRCDSALSRDSRHHHAPLVGFSGYGKNNLHRESSDFARARYTITLRFMGERFFALAGNARWEWKTRLRTRLMRARYAA